MTEPTESFPNHYKGINGHWRTRSLFWETNRYEEKYPSLYSIKDDDNRLPSLRRLYLEMMDPTEYGFAEAHLGGWEHWEHLCAAPWFKPIVAKWRVVLAKKIQNKLALDAMDIINDASASPSAKLRAMNFISQAEYEPKESGKGRPTKARVAGELRRAARASSNVEEDFERLGLKPTSKPN